MKKINILPEKEYIKLYGKPDWTGVDYDDSVYVFIEDSKIVGDCVLFEEKDGIKIDNIEARYKNSGYGRAFVKVIKEMYGKIYGESVLSAIGFWSKMGAIFENNCEFVDSHCSEILINFYIPQN